MPPASARRVGLGVVTLAFALVVAVALAVGQRDDDGAVPLGADDAPAAIPYVAHLVPPGASSLLATVPDTPVTLSFGDVEVVDMLIGDQVTAPVAMSVRSIRRGDVAAVTRARPRGFRAPRHVYYADITLTFQEAGVIDVTPFITLAQGTRDDNVHYYPLALDRPFPPCPGTGEGVTLRGGDPVDLCVVFPGPRPERVRGVSMLDEVGVPTWEGIVS